MDCNLAERNLLLGWWSAHVGDITTAGAWDASSDDDDLGVATPQTGGVTSPPPTHQNTNTGDSGESGDAMPEGVVSTQPSTCRNLDHVLDSMWFYL